MHSTPKSIFLFEKRLILPSLLTFIITCLVQLQSLQQASSVALPSLWLTAGVSLGLCFLFGKKVIYAVFSGILLAQVLSINAFPKENFIAFSVFFSFCITLQTITIYLAFQQISNSNKPLLNTRNFLQFVVIAGFVSFINAILINMDQTVFLNEHSFNLSHVLETFASIFSAIVLVTPALLSLKHKAPNPANRAGNIERIAWLFTALLLGFDVTLFAENSLIVSIPLIIWASVRFSIRESCWIILAYSLFVIPDITIPVSTQANLSLFITSNASYFAWLLLAFSATLFNVLLTERARIESRLEYLVQKRTQELHATNQELQDEMFVRQQAEKSYRASSKRYKALIETTGIPIIVLDSKFCIKQWNRAAENLFGYTRERILQQNFIDNFIPQENQDELAWKFTTVLDRGLSKENLEHSVLRNDGQTLTMLWNMSLLIDDEDDNNRKQLLLIGQNISEIKQTQDQLHYLAHFDALTGTANRRLFEDRCKQAIQSALRHKHQIALITLDVDHFKRINDTLGHDVGDELLVTLTERLESCIRREDTIARLGGDEFAILLANVSGQEGAERVARNILETVTRPIKSKASELVITTSIGITICPLDGTHYPDLLKNADMAMYRAKNAGRNNVQFYSPEMNDEMLRQLHIEQELRNAIQKQEFQLYYQPIVDIETGEVVALEALLRWHHPEKGILRPEYFLHVADQTGQIHDIGRWILEKVCQHGREIESWSNSTIQIALNLTEREYNHPGLTSMIKQITKAYQFNPRNLILEMSEDTLITRSETANSTLQKLSDLGVSLSIDSFGTGLSSLRQLKQIPIDIIKIDRTFVHGIPENQSDMAITETLLAIANQMDLKTFATGIENKDQEAFLKINGCRYAQGYKYSAPLPFDNLPTLFKDIKSGSTLNDADQIFLPFQSEVDSTDQDLNETDITRH